VVRCPYAGNAAARCCRLVNTFVIEVLIHFGRTIRQDRKVNLSRNKTTIGLRGVRSYVYPENSKLMGAKPGGKFKWRVTQRVKNVSAREFQTALRGCI
jgi:hypothetical protein